MSDASEFLLGGQDLFANYKIPEMPNFATSWSAQPTTTQTVAKWMVAVSSGVGGFLLSFGAGYYGTLALMGALTINPFLVGAACIAALILSYKMLVTFFLLMENWHKY